MPPQHKALTDPKALLKEISDNNAYFDDLVDMIPAKLYVAGNSGDGLYNTKYRKGQHKESKEARRARNKIAKVNKFDPDKRETTRQEKARFEREQFEYESEEEDDDNDKIVDEDDDSMSHVQDNHEEEDEDMEHSSSSKKSSNAEPDESNNNNTSNSNSSRIEELRAKLRAKIEEKRSQRPGGNADTMVSKRAARRADKKRKTEIAKKKLQQQQQGGAKSGGKTYTGKTSNKITLVDSEKVHESLGGSKINDPRGASNVGDDLSGIDFGGIAGLKRDLSVSGNYSEANKSLKNKGKKKSLEKLLAAAEAKQDRLRQLKESDDVDAKEKLKKIQWGDTLKAASGDGLKETNTTLIKKAMKRKAKKKAKSQEAWKSRMEQTKDKMDERQRIRTHNIKQRSLGGAAGANLSKKRIKDDQVADGGDDNEAGTKDKKKRPRLGPYAKNASSRAGFEGKKQDFINKGAKGGSKQ